MVASAILLMIKTSKAAEDTCLESSGLAERLKDEAINPRNKIKPILPSSMA